MRNTNTEWEEEESQHLGGILMEIGEQANSFLANTNTNSHQYPNTNTEWEGETSFFANTNGLTIGIFISI